MLLLRILRAMNFHRDAYVGHDATVSQLHRRIFNHHQLPLLVSAIHLAIPLSLRGYPRRIRHRVTRPATHARRASRVHQRHPAPPTRAVRNVLSLHSSSGNDSVHRVTQRALHLRRAQMKHQSNRASLALDGSHLSPPRRSESRAHASLIPRAVIIISTVR